MSRNRLTATNVKKMARKSCFRGTLPLLQIQPQQQPLFTLIKLSDHHQLNLPDLINEKKVFFKTTERNDMSAC